MVRPVPAGASAAAAPPRVACCGEIDARQPPEDHPAERACGEDHAEGDERAAHGQGVLGAGGGAAGAWAGAGAGGRTAGLELGAVAADGVDERVDEAQLVAVRSRAASLPRGSRRSRARPAPPACWRRRARGRAPAGSPAGSSSPASAASVRPGRRPRPTVRGAGAAPSPTASSRWCGRRRWRSAARRLPSAPPAAPRGCSRPG